MGHFAEQAIVVTGASSGIGKAICLVLAEQRAKLVLAARDQQRLEELAVECRKLGGEAIAVSTDVTVEADCKRLIGTAVDRWAKLDALVNCAGLAMWARFADLDDLSVIEQIMRVNYFGSVYCTFHALEHLKRSRGLIVATSSVSGLSGVPWMTGYAASKHAIIGFFESLRIELRSTGVGVTIAAPDFVQSEILHRALGPLGRPLERNPLDERRFMPVDRCARRIVKGMRRRERLVLMSGRSKNMRFGKLLLPALIDRIVAASVCFRG